MYKLLLTLTLAGSVHAAPIKIIGYNGKKIIWDEVDGKQYSEMLVTTKSALDTQVIHGLSNYVDKGARWSLKKIALGLGANGEIGIGPYKFGKSLKQRFVYSR